MYEYAMKLSQYLQDGMKMQFTVGTWTFSWYQVYCFDIIISILIIVIVGILKED